MRIARRLQTGIRCPHQSCRADRPHRNSMSPPKLPADRPVAFFAEPIEIAFGVAIGHDLHAAAGDGVHRRISAASSLVHLHEPLVGQVRLDRRFAAVGVGEVDFAVFDFGRRGRPLPCRRRRPRGPSSSLRPRYFSGTLSFSVPSGFRMLIDADLRVALPDFVVVGVVGGRDLHAAGAELGLGPFVGDERNLAAGERQLEHARRAWPCRGA